ncbi:hypothetical protein EMMF5_004204 [Cystobasidiomycetes sp. EMM_F5]
MLFQLTLPLLTLFSCIPASNGGHLPVGLAAHPARHAQRNSPDHGVIARGLYFTPLNPAKSTSTQPNIVLVSKTLSSSSQPSSASSKPPSFVPEKSAPASTTTKPPAFVPSKSLPQSSTSTQSTSSRYVGPVFQPVQTARAPSSPVVGVYFNDWAGTDLNSYSHFQDFSEMSYFVAVTTADPGYIQFQGYASPEGPYIQQFVQKVHAAGKKALLSIGGWSGSGYFSANVADSNKRAIFANTVKNAIVQYGFDGVTIDWEYPNNPGAGNAYTAADTANFLSWLQTLRAAVGPNIILTADVAPTGFTGPDGNPISNASGFAAVLNYVSLMVYDVSGGWTSTSGPNAPLYARGATAEQAQGADTAVAYWTSAGFPKNKLVIGIPSYGKSFTLLSSTLQTMTNNGYATQAYQQYSGDVPTMTYNDMISQGIITPNGQPTSWSGYTRYFDTASQTPFLFNPSTKVFITYDDPVSFAAKANYAKTNGLAGVKIYDAQGTSDSLVSALKSVYG